MFVVKIGNINNARVDGRGGGWVGGWSFFTHFLFTQKNYTNNTKNVHGRDGSIRVVCLITNKKKGQGGFMGFFTHFLFTQKNYTKKWVR